MLKTIEIYIISKNPININGIIYISEEIFPLDFDKIAEKVKYRERAGWYLQQLLKLTAGFYIPDILDNYLVIDADVYILKKLDFMYNNKPLYAYGEDYHTPYFKHMNKLHPTLKKQSNVSGICHHMMFNKNYIIELFKLVESYTNKNFTDSFIDEITEYGPSTSGASEYEIYFNFMLAYHKNDMIIRPLKWRDIYHISESTIYDDFVSAHHYSRK